MADGNRIAGAVELALVDPRAGLRAARALSTRLFSTAPGDELDAWFLLAAGTGGRPCVMSAYWDGPWPPAKAARALKGVPGIELLQAKGMRSAEASAYAGGPAVFAIAPRLASVLSRAALTELAQLPDRAEGWPALPDSEALFVAWLRALAGTPLRSALEAWSARTASFAAASGASPKKVAAIARSAQWTGRVRALLGRAAELRPRLVEAFDAWATHLGVALAAGELSREALEPGARTALVHIPAISIGLPPLAEAVYLAVFADGRLASPAPARPSRRARATPPGPAPVPPLEVAPELRRIGQALVRLGYARSELFPSRQQLALWASVELERTRWGGRIAPRARPFVDLLLLGKRVPPEPFSRGDRRLLGRLEELGVIAHDGGEWCPLFRLLPGEGRTSGPLVELGAGSAAAGLAADVAARLGGRAVVVEGAEAPALLALLAGRFERVAVHSPDARTRALAALSAAVCGRGDVNWIDVVSDGGADVRLTSPASVRTLAARRAGGVALAIEPTSAPGEVEVLAYVPGRPPALDAKVVSPLDGARVFRWLRRRG